MERSIYDLLINKRDVETIALYRASNAQKAEHYKQLAEDPFLTAAEAHRYMDKAWAIETCNAFWNFEVHPKLKIKDKIGAISCKDKFCPICQKAIQASRENRFVPELDRIAEERDIFHLTLTIPNIPIRKTYARGDNLRETEDKMNAMFVNFKKLTRYLSGNAKIAGLDFSQYGYAGALRNLEIKVNGFSLHPHIHSLVAFRKGIEFEGYNLNKFSYKKDGSVTPFSNFEILIQKIWYLIINNQRVTLETINALPLGYSCRLIKKAAGEYAEIFKYVTKSEEGFDIPFEVFSVLVDWLYNRRCFQGYGVFYRIKPDDTIDVSMSTTYDRMKAHLTLVDRPYQITETLDIVLLNIITGDALYITRAKIAGVLRRLYSDEQLTASGDLEFVNDYLPKQKVSIVYEREPELTEEQIDIWNYIKPFVGEMPFQN